MKKQAKKTPQRWSLGLWRNARGELVTCYCSIKGEPAPYQKKMMPKGTKILFFAVYKGVTFKEARARLLRDSKLVAKKVSKKSTPKEEIRRAA